MKQAKNAANSQIFHVCSYPEAMKILRELGMKNEDGSELTDTQVRARVYARKYYQTWLHPDTFLMKNEEYKCACIHSYISTFVLLLAVRTRL